MALCLPSLELHTHRELNDSRTYRSCCYQPEGWIIGSKGRIERTPIDRKRKLRVVEQIEELAAELQRLSFTNRRCLGDRKVRVGLSRATKDANAGSTPVESVADSGRSAKR